MSAPILCLMGPTASGKSALAMRIAEQGGFEIVSVDSALVYRGMDIGTAKPSKAEQQAVPHHLIDILDPSQSYSAGDFCRDAERVIAEIEARGNRPLLVGGTMLYFNALQQGFANLPEANEAVRAAILVEAESEGWPALHAELARIDPVAAERIQPTDTQRIQRALEVFRVTGQPISQWQQNTTAASKLEFRNLILAPEDRAVLHQRIAERFDTMLAAGFIDEVRALYQRGNLNPEMPSMRAVGYRQAWAHLAGELSEVEMRERAIIATRQLAKRQFTWLRRWQNAEWFESGALIDVSRV